MSLLTKLTKCPTISQHSRQTELKPSQLNAVAKDIPYLNLDNLLNDPNCTRFKQNTFLDPTLKPTVLTSILPRKLTKIIQI